MKRIEITCSENTKEAMLKLFKFGDIHDCLVVDDCDKYKNCADCVINNIEFKVREADAE